MYYEDDISDDDWVECEECHGWYHVGCANLEELSKEELDEVTFVCSLYT